jgi:hypothetical protein
MQERNIFIQAQKKANSIIQFGQSNLVWQILFSLVIQFSNTVSEIRFAIQFGNSVWFGNSVLQIGLPNHFARPKFA